MGHNDTALEELTNALKAELGPSLVRENELLARFTAFRIGGPARLMVIATSREALCQAVIRAQSYNVPIWILGNGSNILVSDAGVQGLVVLNRAQAICFESSSVRAESGASLSSVARRCIARGLGGLEWAVGIPGSVGGAVVGNSGAWGGDVASTLVQSTVLEPGGSIVTWQPEQFGYAYRSSVLKGQKTWQKPSPVILDAEFALWQGERETLKRRAVLITARRKATQPPGATCGSVFKNPSGDYAGRLIEAAGLKGYRVGGAEISPVHANFIVNRGNATAANVKALIDLARQSVQLQFGIVLEPEVELLGD
jgi:UDP-N-acetylmuramate dehydrogenase